jgi:voltage-gated potassium channel
MRTALVRKTVSQAKKSFDSISMLLIVFSLVCFSIETLPDLPPSVREFLATSEAFITVIFAGEYIIRIATSTKRLSYIFSFYGIVDFIAIVPFILGFGFDARAIRIVRIFRIFRVLKLARYNHAIHRFSSAINMAKEELIMFFLAAFMLIYIAAVGIYFFEHETQPEQYRSIFHSLWWSVVTLTTVGYGDIYPVTLGGRIFTSLMLILGLGIVAIPTSVITSAMTQVRESEEDKD